ncbi:unnamed protein product [Hydatigera taeniaeformis]|uniref:Uncharacterized protein n=1 Tax=Hydatigena taeniaeformis TaxID=6205 RepID=A0A3P7EVU4_HYDTA|nr:unnamed protein product [Hydatigera taeniaeformis]
MPNLASVIVRLKGEALQNTGLGNDEDAESGSLGSRHSDVESIENMEDCFSLECLGVIANLQVEGMDFARLLGDLGLLPWAEEVLAAMEQSQHNDDLLLETIRMIATACIDVEAAKMVVQSGSQVIPRLIKLMKSRQEDDEVVFQIICVFYRILSHEETRQCFISNTASVVKCKLSSLFCCVDVNSGYARAKVMAAFIASVEAATGDASKVESDCDEKWAEAISAERFRWRNCQWLQMVEEAEARHNESDEGGEEKDVVEERGGEEDFLRSHGFLLASNLLEDAADWFSVPPPPPSPLNRVVFNSSSKLSANDMAALNGDEDGDAAFEAAKASVQT